MTLPKTGQMVTDKVTGKKARILKVHIKKVDGATSRFYLLKNVPLSPNYPNGWRHAGEIEA